MSSGLGQVSGFLGGAGTGVREAVRRLGVKGLDAGVGCGVGVGYGFGAGLFLKPSAAEQLARLVESAAGNLARHAQATLQHVGLQLPGGTSLPPQQQLQASPFAQGAALGLPLSAGFGIDTQKPSRPLKPLEPPRGTGPPDGSAAAGWQPVLQATPAQQLPPQPQEYLSVNQPGELVPGDGDGSRAHSHEAAASPAAAITTAPTGAVSAREPSAEEFRALLRHERQIARLRAQNRALRNAVCKLDRRLPLCKERTEEEEDDG